MGDDERLGKVGTSALRYMPQLDGLRAVAIGMVLAGHLLPGWGWLQGALPHWLGVRLFFVISGFLITSILLREREAVEEAGAGVMGAAGRFYVRRFLRIFPAYYLVLGVVCASGMDRSVNEYAWWHTAYVSNVLFAKAGTWFGSAGHLWSLAVEEQFYLVWPWVVLLTPRRWLLAVLVGVAAMGPVFRGLAYELGMNHVACMVLTPGCLDFLGVGAVLALLERDGRRRKSVGASLLGVGLPLVGLGYALGPREGLAGMWLAGWGLGVALVSGWVVRGAARGFGGVVGRGLSAGPVRYVGMISYGVYLLHTVAWMALARIGFDAEQVHGPGFAMAKVSATLLLAAGMWHLWERPINGLKRWVPYVVAAGREGERREVREVAVAG